MNFVQATASHDELAQRGFLDLLPQLYSASSWDSPLYLATVAVSLVAYETWHPGVMDNQSQTAQYGRALRATQNAIQNPTESITDATLLTVLMLGLYEASAPPHQLVRRLNGRRSSDFRHLIPPNNKRSDISKVLLLW